MGSVISFLFVLGTNEVGCDVRYFVPASALAFIGKVNKKVKNALPLKLKSVELWVVIW